MSAGRKRSISCASEGNWYISFNDVHFQVFDDQSDVIIGFMVVVLFGRLVPLLSSQTRQQCHMFSLYHRNGQNRKMAAEKT